MENKRVTFGDAMRTESNWGKTWNGADTLVSTSNACLDLFGRGGSLRDASNNEKVNLMLKAYAENPDMAMKLLFYTRDIRGGYGERDTFNTMLRWVANYHTDSVVKNLWAVLEYGRAKDLYSLVGTKAESAMWQFMKQQFEIDVNNMQAGKGVSLLAKWLATPDASSSRTSALGKLTANKLGYTFKTMKFYKKKLRALRKYIDVPEAKMATGKWSEIEYSKVGSQCFRKHREAFKRHDGARFNEFVTAVSNGNAKVNTKTLTPVDIVHDYMGNATYINKELEVLWDNLEDNNCGNVMVICDTSGSMYEGAASVRPIEAAVATTLYLSERNKGDLKNLFITFSDRPSIQKVYGSSLVERIKSLMQSDWGFSTNLEASFDLILKVCVENNIAPEDVPEALVVVSDMQINSCANYNGRITFYDRMKEKFSNEGYKMPQLVFWNVNAKSASFLAQKDAAGATLISGYSTTVFNQVLHCIGVSPEDFMLEVVNSARYKDIKA